MKTTTNKTRKPESPLATFRPMGFVPKDFTELSLVLTRPWTIPTLTTKDYVQAREFADRLIALRRGNAGPVRAKQPVFPRFG